MYSIIYLLPESHEYFIEETWSDGNKRLSRCSQEYGIHEKLLKTTVDAHKQQRFTADRTKAFPAVVLEVSSF